jgi:predicted phosphodiesterase
VRIAIIADTHGNLISLDAVLADIERCGVEQIVCLGDVAGLGPQPREVIARLRALGCPVVMGNADVFMLEPWVLAPENHLHADEMTGRMHDMERWGAAQLDAADRDYIRTFQPTVEVPFEDGNALLCYHGSPLSNRAEIRASTPDAELAKQLGERRTPVMAGGHTHEQFVRRLDETIVLNPGSVGLPYETLRAGGARNPPWAEYAVLTAEGGRLDVLLRRVPVDQAAIRQALLDSGMPHAAWWAADWR